MATTTKRGPSNGASSSRRSAGSSNGNSAKARSNGKSTASSRGRSNSARSRSQSKGSTGPQPAKSSGSRPAATNSTSQTSSGRDSITRVVVPAVTGAVGIAGGILFDRVRLQRNRKFLGIPVPGVKVDMAGVGKQLGEAGRQFGRLAHEVQLAREKAEKISRAIG